MALRSRSGSVAFVLLLAALGAAPASGDYRDDYKAGVDAIGARKYADAVRLLRAAIAAKGEEKSGFRDYFPHYYLGVALAEMGDCRAALEPLRASERQGQIQKQAALVATLTSWQRKCAERVQSADAALALAREAIATARERFAPLDALAQVPELRPAWSEGGADSFQSRRQSLERQLRAIETSLEEPHRALDAGALAGRGDAAAQVGQEITTLESAVRSRLEVLGQAAAAAVAQLEDVEGSLRRMMRSLADLEPYPPELAARLAEAEAALEAARTLSPSAGAATVKKVEDDLTVAMSRLRRAAGRPPQALVEGVEAYLRGDYGKAIAALDGKTFDDARASGHACLLRAAARHALWMLGGERDGESLAAVSAEIVACGRLSPVPEPAERFFSPRFRELYRTSLAVAEGG